MIPRRNLYLKYKALTPPIAVRFEADTQVNDTARAVARITGLDDLLGGVSGVFLRGRIRSSFPILPDGGDRSECRVHFVQTRDIRFVHRRLLSGLPSRLSIAVLGPLLASGLSDRKLRPPQVIQHEALLKTGPLARHTSSERLRIEWDGTPRRVHANQFTADSVVQCPRAITMSDSTTTERWFASVG